MIVPLSAHLGPANTGLSVGYTVYLLDNATVHSAFSMTGVSESPAGSGDYHVAGGINAPDAGGYVAVGTIGNEIIRAGIEPAASASDLTAILDAIEALGVSPVITVISAIDGNDITVYRGDTWAFTMELPVSLSSYEIVAFVVKTRESQSDDEALLYVRSDTGLVRIAGAAPVDSGSGDLTVNGTEVEIKIDMDQTEAVLHNHYLWWLKAFDETPTPDEGYTLATGKFTVLPYGLRAVS